MKGTPLTDEKGWHNWNKAEVGEITFPETGLHLLTLPYNAGAASLFRMRVEARLLGVAEELQKVTPAPLPKRFSW
jgi:hypothetical protein